jgi:hypothetical protein
VRKYSNTLFIFECYKKIGFAASVGMISFAAVTRICIKKSLNENGNNACQILLTWLCVYPVDKNCRKCLCWIIYPYQQLLNVLGCGILWLHNSQFKCVVC